MRFALITGASAGLGVEFARKFAKENIPLILVARRTDRMMELAAELRQGQPGLRIEVIGADLLDDQAAQEIYQKVQALGLDVEFLINNAGFGQSGDFASHTLDQELNVIDLNVRALVALTHFFLPTMIKNKRGRILNVGSTAGLQPGPHMATYYATKAFVNSFSEALHEELAGTGVTCTVLAPGPTVTEFFSVAKMERTGLVKMGFAATAADVVDTGYRAMKAGRGLVVHGMMNRLHMQGLRLLPRAIVRKAAARLNQ